MDMIKHNKGQAGGIVAVVIGLVVGVILLVGVLVPITTSTVSSQNFTGTNKTIADNLTTFILIGVLVLIAGLAYFGMRK